APEVDVAVGRGLARLIHVSRRPADAAGADQVGLAVARDRAHVAELGGGPAHAAGGIGRDRADPTLALVDVDARRAVVQRPGLDARGRHHLPEADPERG